MTELKTNSSDLSFIPLTKERWSDFEALFGVRGACGGCWCMLWRLTRSEFERQKGPCPRCFCLDGTGGGIQKNGVYRMCTTI